MYQSSLDEQARWIHRLLELATAAQASHVYHLLFTDLDLPAFGRADDPQLVPFATIGLVTARLAPKLALAEWDRAFARPRRSASDARAPVGSPPALAPRHCQPSPPTTTFVSVAPVV